MEQKILNLKIRKYQIKVLTQDVDLKYGNILDFKVTYKDNGLRFKSLSKVICQAPFHRKQETGNKQIQWGM